MENLQNTAVETVTVSNATCNNSVGTNCSRNVLENVDPDSSTVSSNIVIAKILLGTVGIISNSIVIVVFASNKNYRKKIPVMFMINQVGPFPKSDCCV